MSLLPKTSSEIEKALERLGERYEFESSMSDLWNPYTCPEPMLIYLAWALSVDKWDNDWSEPVKRQVVLKSLDIHRMKGTTKALQDAVNTLGYRANVEYWTDNSQIDKGKFRVRILASQNAIEPKFYRLMLEVIEENRRGTLHLDKFEVEAMMEQSLRIIGTVRIGENHRITPK